jgi:HD-GYP domain-containing protein (c-di-GMP phosphodiesterase class II)
MVENIKGLEKIAKIVRAHHERYDGDGYPDNMLGDIIPMESRIISIVDSYVAMISERPYKSALSENEAIEELRKGKGKQFDGELVERFIKILKK